MQKLLLSLKTTGRLFLNKGMAILVLLFLMYRFATLNSDHATPFAELLYAGVMIASITVLAPIVRLLVFHEVAIYAEGGGLAADLAGTVITNMLRHYWYATMVSYLITVLCVSHLL